MASENFYLLIVFQYLQYLMSKKICLYVLILVFLYVSIVYELYSKNRQLFHIHTIARGSLSLEKNLNLNSFHAINESYFDIELKLDEKEQKIKKFSLGCGNIQIFNGGGSNFMALLLSRGDIKSHGDSFYEIKDLLHQHCVHQVISSIYLKNNEVFIEGSFSDCSKSQYVIKIFKQDQKQIKINAKAKNNEYNRILLYFQDSAQNNYFGLGQQFSYLNLGHDRPFSLFVRQKGVGRTDQPQTFILSYLYGAGGSYYGSYNPTPIWLSVKIDQTHKSIPLGYAVNSWAYFIWMNNQILVWDSEIEVKIFLGESVKEVLKNIAQFNGYTPPVPDWVNEGAIIGLQGGTKAVMKKYEVLKRSGAKISGLWLQDWVNKRKSLGFSRLWWNWQLDNIHYEGWNKMKKELKNEKVNVLIYMNPMLTDIQGKKQNYTTNYFKTAKQQNYFLKNQEGKDFETSAFADWTASLIDFENQKAKSFYQNILRNALKQTEAEGLMIDFGQAYPVQKMNKTLENAIKSHNQYPTKYHEAAREVLNQFKNQQVYSFSRAGYLFTPKYTLSLWAGDQSMNFKKHSGLPSCLTAMLSSSLIGYSNTHCDIGGYSSYKLPLDETSVRTPLLMTRWMQLAAFSPVFRTHEGNLPQQSLQVYSNSQIADQFSFYSHIFRILSAYRKKQANLSKNEKIPLIRPMFVEHQNDPAAYSISDQYYLGKDILVSPIITKKKSRMLYLPKGMWVKIFSNKQVQGCDCFIESNEQEALPPVLIRSSSQFKDQIISQIAKLIQKYQNKIAYLQARKSAKREEL